MGEPSLRRASLLPKAFLDDGQAGDAIPIVAQLGLELLQESPVDVKDDLHVPWQQFFQETDRPFLQCLWQNGVVGKRKHLENKGLGVHKNELVFPEEEEISVICPAAVLLETVWKYNFSHVSVSLAKQATSLQMNAWVLLQSMTDS